MTFKEGNLTVEVATKEAMFLYGAQTNCRKLENALHQGWNFERKKLETAEMWF